MLLFLEIDSSGRVALPPIHKGIIESVLSPLSEVHNLSQSTSTPTNERASSQGVGSAKKPASAKI